MAKAGKGGSTARRAAGPILDVTVGQTTKPAKGGKGKGKKAGKAKRK